MMLHVGQTKLTRNIRENLCHEHEGGGALFLPAAKVQQSNKNGHTLPCYCQQSADHGGYQEHEEYGSIWTSDDANGATGIRSGHRYLRNVSYLCPLFYIYRQRI